MNVIVNIDCNVTFLMIMAILPKEGRSNSGLCPTECSCVIYRMLSTQYHRLHCIFQTFEQCIALYMHNIHIKYPTQSELEPSMSEFRATTGHQVGPRMM